MPRIVRMPTEQELPRGPKRDFVEALFSLYREARRPTLREISQVIERGDFRATASPETIRRMLRGTTIPSWNIIESVVLALCEMARVNPDANMGYDEPTRRELVADRWSDALDNLDTPLVSVTAEIVRPEADPWESDQSRSYVFSDEPPF